MRSKTVISSDFSQKNCIEKKVFERKLCVLDTKFPGNFTRTDTIFSCRTQVISILNAKSTIFAP